MRSYLRMIIGAYVLPLLVGFIVAAVAAFVAARWAMR